LPRWRALAAVLEERFPDWREARIHEFAPAADSAAWFARRCPHYTYSHFWSDVALGEDRDGVRCEDLGALTFPDATFDLVVTQDVFEHLPDPAAAASEIARVLVPGGTHLFTVPIYPRATEVRAEIGAEGGILHLQEPDFHGDPSDPSGSLVFREWGSDIVDFLRDRSDVETEQIVIEDPRRGISGGWVDVFASIRVDG
jgi:SAM-dependent methyltransferase